MNRADLYVTPLILGKADTMVVGAPLA